MTNLLELKEKSYYKYSKYELDNNEIKELREICYGYGCVLPLTEFFNDIEHNRQENYNKKQAYKDLAYLVQYIQKLEKDLEALELLKNFDFEFTDEGNNDISAVSNTQVLFTREEYELLKEVLKNDK